MKKYNRILFCLITCLAVNTSFAMEQPDSEAPDSNKTCETATKNAWAQAASAGEVEKINELLESGFDVNTKVHSPQRTALHLAAGLITCTYGDFIFIIDGQRCPCIEKKFDGNESQRLAVVNALLAKGADINARDSEGNTPLLIAAKVNFCKILDTLFSAGADINAYDTRGNTPLIYSVKGSLKEIFSKLIEWGADVNHINNNGATALAYAYKNNCLSIGERLLQAGAVLSDNVIGCNEEEIDSEYWLSKKSGYALLHYPRGLTTNLSPLLTYPRTLTAQEWHKAKTILLINKRLKKKLRLPKDMLHLLLEYCFPNFNYVYGSTKQKIKWHQNELQRMLLIKNSDGRLPYQTSGNFWIDNAALNPNDKKALAYRNKQIALNYHKNQLRKISGTPFKHILLAWQK